MGGNDDKGKGGNAMNLRFQVDIYIAIILFFASQAWPNARKQFFFAALGYYGMCAFFLFTNIL